MTTIPFTKVHGCSNDFVLINRDELSPAQREQFESVSNAAWIQSVCNRRTGIGADGVLTLDREDGVHTAKICNADGSDGGMCGNGLRCIALYLLDKQVVTPAQPIPVRMGGRTTEIHIEHAQPFRASLHLGKVQPDHIDQAGPIQQEALAELQSMFAGSVFGVAWAGNPHAVINLPGLPSPGDTSISQKIRRSGLFPDGVNITLATQSDPNHLRAMTDERGVGTTQACASGAAALVAIMHREGLVDSNCVVEMPGGPLSVKVTPDEQNPSAYLARIAGGAEVVFRGEIPISAQKSTA